MSYYSNPGGFSISKMVLPSITSSVYQSAGLNSGGVVRESAIVLTTSTAVGPYIQQLSGSGSGGGGVISIIIISGGSGYTRAPAIIFTGGGGSGAIATCTILGGIINHITITNTGSGYTSAPIVNAFPAIGGVNLEAVISTGSTSTSLSFQQEADNDPKMILLKHV